MVSHEAQLNRERVASEAISESIADLAGLTGVVLSTDLPLPPHVIRDLGPAFRQLIEREMTAAHLAAIRDALIEQRTRATTERIRDALTTLAGQAEVVYDRGTGELGDDEIASVLDRVNESDTARRLLGN